MVLVDPKARRGRGREGSRGDLCMGRIYVCGWWWLFGEGGARVGSWVRR